MSHLPQAEPGDTTADQFQQDGLPPTQEKKANRKNILTAAKGGGIMFSGRLFSYVARFIITFLLARLLGAQEFGLYNLARSTGSMISGISSLGMDTTVVRYVARARAHKNDQVLWGTLQITIGVSTFASIIAGLWLFFMADYLARSVFEDTALIPLFQLISIFIPFLTLVSVVSSATRAFKKMQYTVITQDIFRPLFRLLLIIVVAFIGLNAFNTLMIFGLAELFSFFLVIYFLHHLFSLRRPLRDTTYRVRSIANFTAPIYLSRLITTFQANLQTILLGAMSTITNVGIFTVAARVNLLGGMFLTSVTSSTLPIIAELHSKKDYGQLQHLYHITTRWVLSLNLPVFLVMILFPEAILNIFGESFTDGTLTMIILAWANMIDAGTGMCGAVLDMAGHTKLKLVNSVVQVGLSLFLNFMLIPPLGMVGAAIASLSATTAVNLLRTIEVYWLERLFPYNLQILKPLLAGSATFVVVYFMTNPWFPANTNLFYLIGQAVIGGVSYIVILFLLGISEDDRILLSEIRQRAKSTVSR